MLYVSFLALHLSLLTLWPNVVRSTNVTDDGLAFLPLCIDRHSSRHRVCDPHNLLSEQSRHLLQLALVAGMSRTVCFCGAPCSTDTTLSSRRLVIGALFLKELPTGYESGTHFAEVVRSHWTLGACPGNDILMLAVGSKVYLAFGPLVSQKLVPHCMPNLPSTYKVKDLPEKRIRQLAVMFKMLFLRSCLCGTCDAPQLWFKIVAMLLACMSLLMWLSLFGRRAYLRRNTLMTVRGRYSFSNVTDGGYAHRASLFPLPLFRSPRHQPTQSLLPHSTAVRRQQDAPDSNESSCESASWNVPSGRSSPPPPPYSSIVKSPPTGFSSMLEAPKSDSPTIREPEPSLSPPSYSDVMQRSQQQLLVNLPTSNPSDIPN